MRSPIKVTRKVSDGPAGYTMLWAWGKKSTYTAQVGDRVVEIVDYRRTTLQIWVADWLASKMNDNRRTN